LEGFSPGDAEMPTTLADFIERYAGPGGGHQLELLL
jgi:hypothetical protein